MRQERSSYQTKQKQSIINYFCDHPEIHLTIADLANGLNKQNIHIGMTTLYRQVEHLVKKGLINRFNGIKGTAAYYEYACLEQIKYVHFRCEKCGIIYHLPWPNIHLLKQYIENENKFNLDLTKTIFIGQCSHCQK